MNRSRIFALILTAAIFFLSLEGCGRFSSVYYVHIDDSFSVGEKDQIRDALDDWEGKTKGVAQLNFVDYIPHSVLLHEENTTHALQHHLYIVRVKDRKDNCATYRWHLFYSDVGETSLFGRNKVECIYADWAYPRGYLYSLILHETGHAMGLRHEPSGSDSVMVPYIDEDTNPGIITDTDLRQFCSIYNCK